MNPNKLEKKKGLFTNYNGGQPPNPRSFTLGGAPDKPGM
jgi:hypothetical protein